jgi:large subunit ribosomal protein L22
VATVEEAPRTEVRAEAKYVRAAPRKAQLVADQIRGRTVPEARAILAFLERDAARDVERVLTSAVANAETNHGLVGDDLYVCAAYVGAGPTLKRWRARARGRVARIKKRTCHITVRLAMPSGEAIPEPRGSVVIEPPAAQPEAAPAEETPKPARASQKDEDAVTETEKPRRAPRKKAEEPTEKEKSKSEAKPKAEAKPKRAAKPKDAADAAEKPKRAPRKKKEES